MCQDGTPVAERQGSTAGTNEIDHLEKNEMISQPFLMIASCLRQTGQSQEDAAGIFSITPDCLARRLGSSAPFRSL